MCGGFNENMNQYKKRRHHSNTMKLKRIFQVFDIWYLQHKVIDPTMMVRKKRMSSWILFSSNLAQTECNDNYLAKNGVWNIMNHIPLIVITDY